MQLRKAIRKVKGIGIFIAKFEYKVGEACSNYIEPECVGIWDIMCESDHPTQNAIEEV